MPQEITNQNITVVTKFNYTQMKDDSIFSICVTGGTGARVQAPHLNNPSLIEIVADTVAHTDPVVLAYGTGYTDFIITPLSTAVDVTFKGSRS